MDDVDRAVQKLKEAQAISEWHFRDAVEEIIEAARRAGGMYELDFEEEET